MAEFSIRLHQIDSSDKTFVFPITGAWLASVLTGTDVRATEDQEGELELRLYRSGPDIIVQGTAKATLVVDCSRCLEDVKVPVEASLSLVMSQAGASDDEDDEVESSGDELGRELYEGDELVFDDIVRDHLLLELPMQPRCSDPPCPEWVKQYLTTAEEAEEQAKEKKPDPRLAALQGLADKLKGPKN